MFEKAVVKYLPRSYAFRIITSVSLTDASGSIQNMSTIVWHDSQHENQLVNRPTYSGRDSLGRGCFLNQSIKQSSILGCQSNQSIKSWICNKMESIVPCSRVWKAISCYLGVTYGDPNHAHVIIFVWSLFKPLKEIYVCVYMYIKHISKIHYLYIWSIQQYWHAVSTKADFNSTCQHVFHVKLGMLK